MDEHAARRLRGFAEEAGCGLRGLDATLWRERMERRYRELETAFEWLLDHGRASDALAMACTLAEFLLITDRVATGRDWLDRALAAAPANDQLQAAGLYERGMLAFWQGADEDACSLHGRSLQLARRLGEPTTVALALCGLARVALREDLDWAQTLCEEALQTVDDTDDQLGRTNALHVLGVAAQMGGNLEQAHDLMIRRIQAARRLGDYAAVGLESSNLSMVERQLGNLGRAHHLAQEALRIANQRGDRWLIPYVLNGLAAIAVQTGAFERAATLLGAAATMVERQGNAWPPDEAPHVEHSRAAVTAALDRQRLHQAWSAGHNLPPADAVRYALTPRPDLAPSLVPRPSRSRRVGRWPGPRSGRRRPAGHEEDDSGNVREGPSMLNGDKVVLRPVRERDLAAFIDAHTEISNRGAFFPLGVLSEAALRRSYAETGFWERDEGTLLIWNRDDVMVGHIEFFRPVNYWDAYELSYQLYGQEHAGQGYTTEAVRLLVDYLFGTKKVNRISLVIVPENAPSQRIAEKCGFQLEGTARGALFTGGRSVDVLIYSLLRDDPRPWHKSG